jgi:hypothetical protein
MELLDTATWTPLDKLDSKAIPLIFEPLFEALQLAHGIQVLASSAALPYFQCRSSTSRRKRASWQCVLWHFRPACSDC